MCYNDQVNFIRLIQGFDVFLHKFRCLCPLNKGDRLKDLFGTLGTVRLIQGVRLIQDRLIEVRLTVLALNFSEAIVNSGFALVNYHLIEISSSQSNC